MYIDVHKCFNVTVGGHLIITGKFYKTECIFGQVLMYLVVVLVQTDSICECIDPAD